MRAPAAAETALEPHISTLAEARKLFVHVRDLEVALHPLCRAVCPHDAPTLPEVGYSVPIRDLVVHATQRLEQGLYGNPRAQLARHHGVTRPRVGAQLDLNPLFLPSDAYRVQKRFRRLRVVEDAQVDRRVALSALDLPDQRCLALIGHPIVNLLA